jgi:hypothetical protein
VIRGVLPSRSLRLSEPVKENFSFTGQQGITLVQIKNV